jgi:hypothetical protein
VTTGNPEKIYHSDENLMFLREECYHKVHKNNLKFKVLDTSSDKLLCQITTDNQTTCK